MQIFFASEFSTDRRKLVFSIVETLVCYVRNFGMKQTFLSFRRSRKINLHGCASTRLNSAFLGPFAKRLARETNQKRVFKLF